MSMGSPRLVPGRLSGGMGDSSDRRLLPVAQEAPSVKRLSLTRNEAPPLKW